MSQNDNSSCEYGRLLSRRIDAMEVALAKSNDKLTKVDEKIDDVDKRAVRTEEVLKNVEASNNKVVEVVEIFTNTMHQVEKTMIAMQYEIKENAGNIKKVEECLDGVKSEVKVLNEKSKIDILEILRSVFSDKISWVLSGGFLIAIILFIWKNWDIISQIKW